MHNVFLDFIHLSLKVNEIEAHSLALKLNCGIYLRHQKHLPVKPEIPEVLAESLYICLKLV